MNGIWQVTKTKSDNQAYNIEEKICIILHTSNLLTCNMVRTLTMSFWSISLFTCSLPKKDRNPSPVRWLCIHKLSSSIIVLSVGGYPVNSSDNCKSNKLNVHLKLNHDVFHWIRSRAVYLSIKKKRGKNPYNTHPHHQESRKALAPMLKKCCIK